MKRLFVANLEYYKVGETELRDLFERFGELKDVYLVRNRETDLSRGMAFIEFRKDQDAERAMKELDGVELHGRKIAVQKATERTYESQR